MSDGAGALIAVAVLVLIPIGLLSIFKTEEMWHTLEAWKYKNPEAAEPSETKYALQRAGGVVTLFIAGILILAAAASGENDQEEQGPNLLQAAIEQRNRDTTLPRATVPLPFQTTTTVSGAIDEPTTVSIGSLATEPSATSAGPSTTTSTETSTDTSTEIVTSTESKVVSGTLTVSNPENTDQTVDRYLLVSDGDGRVVSRTPLSVEVPARSSVDLDPTPFIDLDLMAFGTYYWSISQTASGSEPINSGIFAVNAAPR